MARAGLDGYGWLHRVYEIICEAWTDPNSPPELSLPIRSWCMQLGIHSNRFKKYLRMAEICGVLEVNPIANPEKDSNLFEGTLPDTLTLVCPKLLKWRDESMRKSGKRLEKKPLQEEEAEEEVEEEVDLSSDKSDDLPDPLDPYPALHDFWDTFCEYLTTTHPRIRLPAPNTRGEYDARKALADLVRLDGFPEREVVDCLDWLFTDPHEDADFWRQQVQGIPTLRRRKTGELSKFGKIHTKWQRARNRPRSRNRAAEMVYAADDPFAIDPP